MQFLAWITLGVEHEVITVAGALGSIRCSTQTPVPMAMIFLSPSTAVQRDPWHPWRPAPSQVACVRCESAKLRTDTVMDHPEHVLIDRTSIPIRIVRRIRGEVEVFTASLQVSRHVAAVCKTVGSTLRNRRSAGLVKSCGAEDGLRHGMADMGALRDACIGQSSSAAAAF